MIRELRTTAFHCEKCLFVHPPHDSICCIKHPSRMADSLESFDNTIRRHLSSGFSRDGKIRICLILNNGTIGCMQVNRSNGTTENAQSALNAGIAIDVRSGLFRRPLNCVGGANSIVPITGEVWELRHSQFFLPVVHTWRIRTTKARAFAASTVGEADNSGFSTLCPVNC